MRDFLKKYQGFVANLLALGMMLGACFGAVVYIQDAPNKAISALAMATAEADKVLESKIVAEAATLRNERTILKNARDKEVEDFRTEVRNNFNSLKSALDRIEARQYDERKRAERLPAFHVNGG